MTSITEPPVELVHPCRVWLYRQNKPSYIVRDLSRYGVPAHVAYAILAARGVFKWLAVRRDLIKLKDRWRGRLKDALTKQKTHLDPSLYNGMDAIKHETYWRGYRKALEECRKEVRLLCHSPRWRAPDFDGDAWRWMETVAPGVVGDISPQLRRELRLAHGHNKAEHRCNVTCAHAED